jgi:hypothetical protein
MRNRDYPSVRRLSDHRERLAGRGVRNRAAPSAIFFKNRKRFCGTRKVKGVSSRPHHVCYWGQFGSECPRGVFAVPKAVILARVDQMG